MLGYLLTPLEGPRRLTGRPPPLPPPLDRESFRTRLGSRI